MTTTTLATKLRSGSWEVLPHQTTAAFEVRKLGAIRVRGTIAVEQGVVTIEDGQPVAANAALEGASVSTGIKKRDIDLTGGKFFAIDRHPQIRVQVQDIRTDGDGWAASGTLTVAGGTAPIALRVRREPDPDAASIRVVATGVLDRSTTPITAPRWLVGRWVAIEVDATLRHRP